MGREGKEKEGVFRDLRLALLVNADSDVDSLLLDSTHLNAAFNLSQSPSPTAAVVAIPKEMMKGGKLIFSFDATKKARFGVLHDIQKISFKSDGLRSQFALSSIMGAAEKGPLYGMGSGS